MGLCGLAPVVKHSEHHHHHHQLPGHRALWPGSSCDTFSTRGSSLRHFFFLHFLAKLEEKITRVKSNNDKTLVTNPPDMLDIEWSQLWVYLTGRGNRLKHIKCWTNQQSSSVSVVLKLVEFQDKLWLALISSSKELSVYYFDHYLSICPWHHEIMLSCDEWKGNFKSICPYDMNKFCTFPSHNKSERNVHCLWFFM